MPGDIHWGIAGKVGVLFWAQFNLENEEVECAQREVELWRRDPSCPMIIEACSGCFYPPLISDVETDVLGVRGIAICSDKKGARSFYSHPPWLLCRSTSNLGPLMRQQHTLVLLLRRMLEQQASMAPMIWHISRKGGFVLVTSWTTTPYKCIIARSGQAALGLGLMTAHCTMCRTGRRLLERWVLSYAPASPADAKAGAGRPMTSRLEPAAIYKRMVISLRSLFSYVRVLPAYRLFRACAVSTARTSQLQGFGYLSMLLPSTALLLHLIALVVGMPC